MLRYIVRTIGLILLASGLAALIIDGTRSIAASKLIVTTFGQTAAYLFPKTYPVLKPAIETNIHPLMWDPFFVALFLLPTCFILAFLGLLLIWIVRRRRVTIGYSNRD